MKSFLLSQTDGELMILYWIHLLLHFLSFFLVSIWAFAWSLVSYEGVSFFVHLPLAAGVGIPRRYAGLDFWFSNETMFIMCGHTLPCYFVSLSQHLTPCCVLTFCQCSHETRSPHLLGPGMRTPLGVLESKRNCGPFMGVCVCPDVTIAFFRPVSLVVEQRTAVM